MNDQKRPAPAADKPAEKAGYEAQTVEKKWQSHWLKQKTYAYDTNATRDESYVIDTPPPTVSGYLHMGHVYSYTQADILARFQRMAGKHVFYPIGFDDNGLPTERLVEKQRGIKAADMSREDFIKVCHEVVQSSEEDFRVFFNSIGLSVDWDQEYQTISPDVMRLSQLSVLDLFEKGHLYREPQPSLWDPADRTAIAQAEISEKEQPGTMWDVAFGLDGGGEIVIATTRPELIGACGALLIHPEHPRAKELVGKLAVSPLYGVQVPIIADDTVDPTKGTGVVMCCTFGDVTDIEWWKKHNLPARVIVDNSGRLTDMPGFGSANWLSVSVSSAQPYIDALKGLSTKQAKTKIVEFLKDAGHLRGETAVTRMVPCAERSGAPLEIIVTPQWFVRVLDKKEALIEKGRRIKWHPEHMRVRFEQWTENLKWDWCISRQRFFGVPFPFWYSKRKGEEGKILVASMDQLPVDPLRDLPKGYSREEVEPERDVMDTWATSSISPQLSSHGISKGKMVDEKRHHQLFPAHMRPQAHEIIRTWAFYTIVKSHLHEDSIPWENVAISGWCLAEDRTKMSKSKGNVVTPESLLEKHGADAVRYWTGTSRLGLDTALAEDVLKVGKRLVTKLYNAARFAMLQLEDFAPKAESLKASEAAITHPLDRWLATSLSGVIARATEHFANYDYADALREIERFFWSDFCDNYLELVKARSYGELGNEADRISAHTTLYFTIEALIRLFAPFLPHITEELYATIFPALWEKHGSVHARGMWPKAGTSFADEKAFAEGQFTVELLAAARKAKSLASVSLKTPVSRFVVAGDATPIVSAQSLADLSATLSAPAPEFVAKPVDGLTEVPVGEAAETATFRVQLALAPQAAA